MTVERIEDFHRAAEDGWLSFRDQGPLTLYCYTAKCAHERAWTPVTRAARGIVFDRGTGAVVARPFPKFFNLGEMPETQPDSLPHTGFTLEEKLDGSLGILFHYAGKWNLCTKGAFDSPQAQHARAELLPKYDLAPVMQDWTLLVEILYPENRIVVDYADRRELVLLSAIHRDSGDELDPSERDSLAHLISMRPVGTHRHWNLLELPFQENAEGYVARFDGGLRVKVKSPRYVQIHRLLEYVSPKRILEMIENGSIDEVRRALPNDLAGRFDEIAASLRLSIYQMRSQAQDFFGELSHLREDRKAFALEAQTRAPRELLPTLFAQLDGKDFARSIFKALRSQMKEEIEDGEPSAPISAREQWDRGDR